MPGRSQPMAGMVAVAMAAQRAAATHAGWKNPEEAIVRCICQCHTTFLPNNQRRLQPVAVAQRLCQECYDEFYADWSLVVDDLMGA